MPSRYHACQHCYTVYGYAPVASEERSVLGFNGQHRSLGTDLYVLGNGYRIYSTTLNRFYSADHLSPFGHGGINAYAYCAGDPVNRDDPSGHMWRRRIGNTLQTTGRQPAGRHLTRPNSVSSSRSSSVESLSSSSSSRSRSRSRSRSPVSITPSQSLEAATNGSSATGLMAHPSPERASSRRLSTSSTSSTISVSELSVPLDHMFEDTDIIATRVLDHMATHASLPIDEEISFRFNHPTTTFGMPSDIQRLASISHMYGAEWFNAARVNLLKRQS